ncbi:hypothetical protein FB451DRAFT_1267773 [Mycena latifolia]|nr:hypothetical protein FB451DRAFT_1267773 [Mycena latifolia]
MAIADIRRRLAELDEQIIKQNMVLRGLEQQRTAVQRELYATATYPVLTLPNEIIAEIFIQCLPVTDDLRDDPVCEMTEELQTNAPILLMGVCRTWRDIVLTTPMLWSTLHIRFNYLPYRLAENPGIIETFIDRWLGCAADCPLSIVFRVWRQWDNDWAECGPFPPSRMRAVIHRYAQRVYYLELDMTERDIRQLGLDSVAFPVLQRATLGYHQGPEPDPHPAQVFGNAPRFHDLHLLFHGTVTLANFSFPCLQLTKFVGEINNMDLFTLAPNLAEVTCYFEDISPPAFMITHLRLGSITLVESWAEVSPDDIFQYITLPSLRSIDVSRVEPTAYASLEPFLKRSTPSLTTLSIEATDSDSGFAEWLGCVVCVGETLENLELVSPSARALSSIFNWRPAYTKKPISSLPNLRTLTLLNPPGNLEYLDLVNFLYRRSGKLRSFRLLWDTSPFMDMEVLAEPGVTRRYESITSHLAQIANAGTDIYIGTVHTNYAQIDRTGTATE